MARKGGDRDSPHAYDSASARREVGGTVTRGAKCARGTEQLTWRLRKRRHTEGRAAGGGRFDWSGEPLVCRIAAGLLRRRVVIAVAIPSSAAAAGNATESVGS